MNNFFSGGNLQWDLYPPILNDNANCQLSENSRTQYSLYSNHMNRESTKGEYYENRNKKIKQYIKKKERERHLPGNFP